MDRLGKIGATTMMYHGILPPGARWVEYLESTGTQWIDTGVSLANVRNWVGACEITRTQNSYAEQPIFSTWVTFFNQVNTFIRDPFSDNHGSLDQYVSGHLTIEGFVRNQKKMIRSGFDIDGIYGLGPNVRFISLDTETKTDPLTTVSSNPTTLKLFTRGDLIGLSVLRMFSFSLLIDTEYAIDCIPVRFTNEQGQTEGAMYDRVSGKLFRNAGTGSFIIGPDISAPAMGGGRGGGNLLELPDKSNNIDSYDAVSDWKEAA